MSDAFVPGEPADVVSIRGGSHGVAASYVAVRGLARRVDVAAARLRGSSERTARAATDRELLESAILSPGTAIEAETAIVAASIGARGLLVESTAWEATATAIRAAVELLESIDEAQRQAWEVIDYAIGYGAGKAAGPVALGVAGLLATGLVTTEDLEDLLTEHPGLVEHLANGGGGLLEGLLSPGPPTGLIPTTEDAAAIVGSMYPSGPGVLVDHPGPSPVGAQPSSTEELLSNLALVAGMSQGADSPDNGTIAIQTVTMADGHQGYIVYVPGTDDLATTPWSADDDVRDMGTNYQMEGGLQDGYTQGIEAAMTEHGIGADDPVMIVGHSQGGMAAAQIAASGSHNVTHVVTAGAPTAFVGHYSASTQVLSIENQGDIVPMTDGEPNPDLVNQTTVVVDAHSAPGIQAHHAHDNYIAGGAAVDASDHPSVTTWTQSAHSSGFFAGGHAPSQIYQIVRGPQG